MSSCTRSREPRRSPLMWVHSPSAASCAFFLSAYCGSLVRGVSCFRTGPQCRTPQFAYRFIHRVYVFGTQTRSGNEPFQHLPFRFDHLRFFFFSIEAVVIATRVSSDAWTIEEFVGMATSVRVECEDITELSWEDERQHAT